jgi:hypothetical protein
MRVSDIFACGSRYDGRDHDRSDYRGHGGYERHHNGGYRRSGYGYRDNHYGRRYGALIRLDIL